MKQKAAITTYEPGLAIVEIEKIESNEDKLKRLVSKLSILESILKKKKIKLV